MTRKVEMPAQPVSFVGAYQLDDASICDDLIACFHANSHLQTPGKVMAGGGTYVIEPRIKESVDLTFQPNSTAPEFVRYVRALQECVEAYIADYGFCNRNAPWTILEQTA